LKYDFLFGIKNYIKYYKFGFNILINNLKKKLLINFEKKNINKKINKKKIIKLILFKKIFIKKIVN